jgi:hypothetical protein
MRRFASGVAAADNYDIERLHERVLRADSNPRQNVSRESIGGEAGWGVSRESFQMTRASCFT